MLDTDILSLQEEFPVTPVDTIGKPTSVFNAAARYAAATNFTSAGISYLKTLIGPEDMLTVEQVRKLGLKTDIPLHREQVNYRLRALELEKQFEYAVAANAQSPVLNITSAIIGAIGTSILDPVAIVGSFGVGSLVSGGLKAFKATKLLGILQSSNKGVSIASRVGLYGTAEAGFNVGSGMLVSEYIDREYTDIEFAADTTLGLIFGAAFPQGLKKAVKQTDIAKTEISAQSQQYIKLLPPAEQIESPAKTPIVEGAVNEGVASVYIPEENVRIFSVNKEGLTAIRKFETGDIDIKNTYPYLTFRSIFENSQYKPLFNYIEDLILNDVIEGRDILRIFIENIPANDEISYELLQTFLISLQRRSKTPEFKDIISKEVAQGPIDVTQTLRNMFKDVKPPKEGVKEK